VVGSNYVGGGVVRESGVKHGIDGSGDGGGEGLIGCWEWCEGPQSTVGCGSHVGEDYGVMEGDGDGVAGEECIAAVVTELGDGQ
jgi:hypothetical protein